MRETLRKITITLGSTLFTLLFVSLSFAQQATVIHKVNLRPDPSSTNPPVRLLNPPESVTLVEPNKTNGYYHVRTQHGEEGWVWGRNLSVVSGGAPARSAGAPAVGTTTSTSAISPDWDKPDPVTGDFQAADGACGPAGNDVDTPTNLRKNRTDVPNSYHELPFDAIATLPYPSPAPTKRVNWSSQQLGEIKPYEGVAVSVVGYIAAVKVEGKESTNCGWTKSSEVDWHIPLVGQAGQGEPDAVVVETTPRIRVSHPNWTVAALAPYKGSQTPVRISGWLMFDPEHPNHLGKYRTTLWEIHPVTKIEVSMNGQWVDLDQ
ncbi:MAG: hypothetical protein WBC04_24605 [Candidatus Acidiferrales bacterium]